MHTILFMQFLIFIFQFVFYLKIQYDNNYLKFYIQVCYGQDRSRFLNRWAAGLQSRSIVALDGDRVVGYATLRPADTGYRIAPIYGDNPDVIRSLFRVITEKHTSENDNILMNVPTTNETMMQVAKDLSLQQAYSLRRMYTKEIIMPPLDKIGSLMTMEVTVC